MKFWCQKLQSCILALRLFGAKILYKKRVRKTLMKLTTVFKQFIDGGNLSAEERKQLDSIQYLSKHNFVTGAYSFSDNAHQVCRYSSQLSLRARFAYKI